MIPHRFAMCISYKDIMKRYSDYMDNIEVSDTLHRRLAELEAPQKRRLAWKKYGTVAAALVLVAGVGAYGLSRGGWNAIMDSFKPAAEVAPGIAEIPAPFPDPDIAIVDPNDPYAPPDRTNGGYELIDGEFAAYYPLPYLEWADASSEVEADYSLAPLGAVQRDMTLDDILLYAGGEKAMADHLLWDGLDWEGTVWFVDKSTPCAVHLHADGEDGMCFSLEVMKGSSVPSCEVPVNGYHGFNWQGVIVSALKNDGIMIGNSVWVQETRIVSFFSNGIGYKLTFRDDNSERADELCARFVRYAVDGGFHLYALSYEPAYDEDLPYEDGGLPDRGFPPEDAPNAGILHPGDPGYIEPFPEPAVEPDEASAPKTTPYNPNMMAETKSPTPPN